MAVSSRAGGVALLPVLEAGPAATVKVLSACLAAYEGAIESTPERVLLVAIETAVTGPSDYWAALAVNWLGVLAPSREILEVLERLVQERWASQTTRHAAGRILRAWRGRRP